MKQKKHYELVRTVKQQQDFERTWEYFCRKYRWVNDTYAPDGIRYNLILPKRHLFQKRTVIGTAEFIPFDPVQRHQKIKELYREHAEFESDPDRVWEIDKLCLHQAYQRQGYFQIFLLIFMEHALAHRVKFYIGHMEEKFFRMLRIWYGLELEAKGKPVRGAKASLVPVLFDVEKALCNEEKVKRVLYME